MRQRLASGIGAAAVAFAAAAQGAEGQIAYLAHGDAFWQVWLMEGDGSGVRQLTRSAYEKARAEWYPDGSALLVSSLDGRQFRVDAETGAEERVPIPVAGAVDAVVSPDGARIAFSVSTAGSVDDNEIWIANADGSAPGRLTKQPGLQHEPRWSVDGQWIYFVSGDGGASHDIFKVSLASRALQQLTVDSLYQFELDVAPDGQLAFSSNRSGNYEIYSAAESAKAVRWTDDPALDGHPSWTPNGRSLVFHSTRAGALNLFRVDAPGGEPRQLTHHSGSGARDPAVWRPRKAR